MAAEARRETTTRYRTYGNVAYDEAWNGAAAPGREEVLRPRPNVRPKERLLARPRVRVRPAGSVSPFAVVGFFCVGVMALLLLMSSVRMAVVNDETVKLRSQLAQLQEEEAKLAAQYEIAYDLQAIEAEMTSTGAMVKPASSQLAPLDLSEPDNVVVYEEESSGGLLSELDGLLP